MKNFYIYLSCIGLLFSCSSKENTTNNFKKTEMTVSNKSDGWGGDVKLSILTKIETDSGNVFKVVSTFKGKDLGFDLFMPKENSDGGFGKGLILSSSGEKSNLFLEKLGEIYEIKGTSNKFTKSISLSFVDLEAMVKQLGASSSSEQSSEKGYKLFFENEKENAELFLNINEQEGWVELAEKDSEYRNAVLRFLGN